MHFQNLHTRYEKNSKCLPFPTILTEWIILLCWSRYISLYSIQGGPTPNAIFAGYVSFQTMISMFSGKVKYAFLALRNKKK